LYKLKCRCKNEVKENGARFRGSERGGIINRNTSLYL
jgi:hypothetical protein